MHCLQVYLPSEVSYIGFGVFSMHPPAVLASLFFLFPELFFFSLPSKTVSCLNVNVVETKKQH